MNNKERKYYNSFRKLTEQQLIQLVPNLKKRAKILWWFINKADKKKKAKL